MCEIEIDESGRRFLLNGENYSYACGVNASGFLIHLHWGNKLARLEDLSDADELQTHRHRLPGRSAATRQEYPGWGGELYGEPALKASFADGSRNCLLEYRGFAVNEDAQAKTLVVTLAAAHYPLKARLFYRLFKDCDILERWSEIANNGAEQVTLFNLMSASFNLPRIDRDYRLSHLAGRWAKEHCVERQPVKQGKIILECRTGLSGPYGVPFFALDEGDADENSGQVRFGTLHWSGNWKMAVERDPYDQVSVCGGINDFDFSQPLAPGGKVGTPVFSAGISEEGFGGMSRMLHDYQLCHILPPELSARPMPFLFNSWGSLGVELDEKKILAVAEKAAEIGAELFVIDDGWQAALGDWFPDPAKFPNGLRPVIEKVKQLGMDFGLWVEIESFEMNSELYRRHPEWAMTYPGQEPPRHERPDIGRTSMMLNFAIKDVADHIYDALAKLVKETGISYLKLDMNCFFTSPGWESAAPEKRQSIWVEYVRNLYSVLRGLRLDFPNLLIENCAAGGGRADLGMSQFCSRINRSDNQDALDVLRLHEGFTWLHPSRLAGGGCHISDASCYLNERATPLCFQAFAGMLGSLSVGKNLPGCSPEELQQIKAYGDLYKEIRKVTQFGRLYRLASHWQHPYAVFEFVSLDKQEAVVFAFGHALQFARSLPNLKLQGLSPDASYEIELYGADEKAPCELEAKSFASKSGKALMSIGVPLELLGDYAAKMLRLKAIG